MYLGTSARAAASETLATNPQLVWRTSVARGIIGAPALSEDVVALSLVDKRVALLERSTGTVLWTRRLQQTLGAGPLIVDDRILVSEQSLGGRTWALRLSNGATIWSTRTGDVIAPLALSVNVNALYVASAEGWVGRLEPQHGAFTWKQHLNGGVRAAPLVTPGGLVVATQADSIYLLDKENGHVLVRRGTRGTVLAAPALGDSTVVFGTTAGKLEAVDPLTLVTRWSVEAGDVVVGSVALRGGKAYAYTSRGMLVIVPLTAPGAALHIPVGLAARAGPAPAPQGVFIGGVTGDIVLVDTNGTRLWTAHVEPPINEALLLDARTLFAVSLRGDMVMYR
jgi:outer membrane protein assembly factor BamB